MTRSSSSRCVTVDRFSKDCASPEASLRRTPYAIVKKRHQSQTHPRANPSFEGIPASFRRHRPFEDELRASTHTVVYDSSKPNGFVSKSTSIPIRRGRVVSDEIHRMKSSLGGSGNESDYDNNQYPYDFSHSSKSTPLPVNEQHSTGELTRIDDLLLGDQNEIILQNETHLSSSQQFEPDDDDERPPQQQQQERNPRHSTSDDYSHPLSDNPSNYSSHYQHHFHSTRDDSVPTNTFVSYRKDPLTARKIIDIRSHLLLNTTLDAT